MKREVVLPEPALADLLDINDIQREAQQSLSSGRG